jgi:4-hydroxy-4-methyl-2-oxoglutarate aldolase
MIEEPKLIRIKRKTARPTAAQIAALGNVPTGVVNDALWGRGALHKDIKPVDPNGQMGAHAVGAALTVETGPADILALLASLAYIQSGDIVVQSFGAHQGCAAAGDRVSGMMKNCGAVGFVTDGPMRDLAGLREVNLPSWCTGLTPASPFGKGPGTVGFDIQMSGQTVRSGDVIVADLDGVVVIPLDELDTITARCHEILKLETELDAKVREGLTVPQDIKDLLASDHVAFED